MKTVNVLTSWYESLGDGDCDTEEVEITDEDYAVLRKYFRTHEAGFSASGDIDDDAPEVKAIAERIEGKGDESLEEHSYDGYELLKKEGETEGKEFDEWYDKYTTSSELQWEDGYEYSFRIGFENGEETEITMYVSVEESNEIDDTDIEEFEDNENLKDLFEDLGELIEKKLKDEPDCVNKDCNGLKWKITEAGMEY